ncbi:SPOR domain-containing protein [Kangiella sp. M94]
MDEKLKYRLVGASVILALAVFFLPMILDSEKYRSQIQSQIPEIPSENQLQQSDSIDQQDGMTPFEATGPVEKGPLVINLDDEGTQQTKQVASDPVTVTKPNDQTQQAENQLKPQQSVEMAEHNKTENTQGQEIATKPVEKQQPEVVAQVESKSNAESAPKTQIEPKSKPQPQAEPQSKDSTESELAFSDSAWLIQIGSFSNKENATKLVTSLRDQGYRAYQRVGDTYARVYVGPYPVKGEAEKRTEDLEKVVGSKVKVIEFDPKQH